MSDACDDEKAEPGYSEKYRDWSEPHSITKHHVPFDILP